MTAVSNKIHWLAPTTIVLSLLVGTAFAVGHHLFYWNLDGDTAQNDNVYVLGTSVSRQQLNIAGGTAFAFIVKAALTTAVSIAYVQLLWRNLTRSSSQAATLCTFNNLFAVFNNGFLLGKVWIWWRYPLLFCLAATAWYYVIATSRQAMKLTALQADTHRFDYYTCNALCDQRSSDASGSETDQYTHH